MLKGIFVVQKNSDSQSIKCAKSVYDHPSPNVSRSQLIHDQLFVETVEENPNDGHHEELQIVSLPNDGTKGNQLSSNSSLTCGELEWSNFDSIKVVVDPPLPESSPEKVVLERERGDPKAHGETGELDLVDEAEKESEADVDHDVNVLEVRQSFGELD